MRDALELWRHHRQGHGWTDEELRQLCEEALASGPGRDSEEFFDELLAELARDVPAQPA